MDIKKILAISVIGILFLTTVYSYSQLRDTKKELNQVTILNKSLEQDNKKLLDANTKVDKELDELSKKFDSLNKELTELKANETPAY
ncbi:MULTISPECIES: hypothetical protein [Vagococcus]|uniref:hypothetical protein n=1 Tax=Vagococcus TaxID=2737 RepID=UPI002FCB868F